MRWGQLYRHIILSLRDGPRCHHSRSTDSWASSMAYIIYTHLITPCHYKLAHIYTIYRLYSRACMLLHLRGCIHWIFTLSFPQGATVLQHNFICYWGSRKKKAVVNRAAVSPRLRQYTAWRYVFWDKGFTKPLSCLNYILTWVKLLVTFAFVVFSGNNEGIWGKWWTGPWLHDRESLLSLDGLDQCRYLDLRDE